MCATLPTLSVSAVFCLYEVCQRHRQARARLAHERRLRERVAFMLWAAATLEEEEPPPVRPAAASGGATGDDEE